MRRFKKFTAHSLLLLLVVVGLVIATTAPTQAAPPPTQESVNLSKTTTDHQCGEGKKAIETAIDLGCQGKGNAFLDMMFAIIRFLSNGVGLILIASLVLAGIQYTISRDDPQGVTAARNRIQSVVISLLIFVFAYAILNYLIPGSLLG